jgi:tRNA (guanine-N7-)-methyltransferase
MAYKNYRKIPEKMEMSAILKNRGIMRGTKRLSHRKWLDELFENFRETAVIPEIEGSREIFQEIMKNPVIEVEIGFGKGMFLLSLAKEKPGAVFIGIETRAKYCSRIMERIKKIQFANIKVVYGDARIIISEFFTEAKISRFYVLFPDPWWKTRHSKKRLFNKKFINDIYKMLVSGGSVFFKTDVEVLFWDAVERFSSITGFIRREWNNETEKLPLSNREKGLIQMKKPVFSAIFMKV